MKHFMEEYGDAIVSVIIAAVLLVIIFAVWKPAIFNIIKNFVTSLATDTAG